MWSEESEEEEGDDEDEEGDVRGGNPEQRGGKYHAEGDDDDDDDDDDEDDEVSVDWEEAAMAGTAQLQAQLKDAMRAQGTVDKKVYQIILPPKKK